MKLKYSTKKKIKGSITILLVLILMPMMTFSAMIVDMSRLNMAKSMISGAGDLAMNTALANYDTILKDVYGLFAMSQTEGDGTFEDDIKAYFERTLVGYGVVSENEAGDYVEMLFDQVDLLLLGDYRGSETTNFMNLDISTVTATKEANSGLNNPDILRKQIVEYMKYRAPLEMGMSFLDSLKAFQAVDDQGTVVQAQVAAQESTQDVTTACRNLINMIRAFDTAVLSMGQFPDGTYGSEAVFGNKKHGDNVLVGLMDYGAQADKYFSTWDYNYTHINKIVMVFLAKSPTVDSIYLTGLDYAGNVFFVKTDGTGIVYDGSGIALTITDAATTADAKTRLDTQLGLLNGKTHQDIAKGYPAAGYINSSYLVDGNMSFKNEEEAIKAFISYENFLLDKGTGLKYTSVAATLDALYTLGKYYDDYDGKISGEIDTAKKNLEDAQQRQKDAQDVLNYTETWVTEQIGLINTAIETLLTADESITSLKKNTTLQTEAKNLLKTLPEEEDGAFTDYYNTHLAGTAENKYLELYKKIVVDKDVKGTSSDAKKICKAAEAFLTKANGKSFSTYMTEEKVNTNHNLYKLLNCLLTASDCANKISEYAKAYDEAPGKLEQANADIQTYQNEYDTKTQERTTEKTNYENCLKSFVNFGKAYQTDAYHYNRYITTAQNIVTTESSAIATQFGDMIGNVELLYVGITAIQKQIKTTKEAIETYNKKLESWESAKNDYVEENGDDSFSKQTGSDINKANTEYDLDSLEKLKSFVDDLEDQYKILYDRLHDNVHYKYGSTKIHELKDHTSLLTAISSVKAELPEVVTVQDATTTLSKLYNSEAAPTYDLYTISGKQMTFLSPVMLQLSFLKYIDGAFPATSQLEEDEKKEIDDAYEGVKDEVVVKEKTEEDSDKDGDKDKDKDKESESEKDKKDEAPPAGYGYNYAGHSVPSSGMPSTGIKGEEVKEGDYSATESEDGKLNASESVSNQTSNSNGILSGIGTAVTAGIENAYILMYIFENFSYNTIIQDTIIEQTDTKTYANALTAVKDSENITKAKGSLTTLSNFPINANNNYLFGGEVEYILYGNAKASTNVTYAKTSIYAVRFLFNCIYAFTNSEIRTTTMSAGLAVQAATLGVVPYQVVQIVLQLALAAAESAIDLDMMNKGLSVAIVKTTDTWVLSISGAANEALDAVKEAAVKEVGDAVASAVNKVGNGLQGLVDAGADEIKGAIEDVSADLTVSTKAVIQDFVDQVFIKVQGEIEAALNELQILDTADAVAQGYNDARDMVQKKSDELFQNIYDTLDKTIDNLAGDNAILSEIKETMKTKASGWVKTVQDDVDATIKDAEISSLSEVLSGAMTKIKQQMVEELSLIIDELSSSIQTATNNAVSGVQNQINGYLENWTEEAAEEARTAVTDLVNGYINDYIDVGNTDAVGGGSTNSSVASMIKFGYKDYLMLFLYIKICVNDSTTLKRTADLIQLNIAKAGDKASFKHAEGAAFSMTNAKTYVSVSVTADLDMFFMDLDLFQQYVKDDTTTTTTSQVDNTGTTIDYRGILGY